jgi:hypothetical protein
MNQVVRFFRVLRVYEHELQETYGNEISYVAFEKDYFIVELTDGQLEDIQSMGIFPTLV